MKTQIPGIVLLLRFLVQIRATNDGFGCLMGLVHLLETRPWSWTRAPVRSSSLRHDYIPWSTSHVRDLDDCALKITTKRANARSWCFPSKTWIESHALSREQPNISFLILHGFFFQIARSQWSTNERPSRSSWNHVSSWQEFLLKKSTVSSKNYWFFQQKCLSGPVWARGSTHEYG